MSIQSQSPERAGIRRFQGMTSGIKSGFRSLRVRNYRLFFFSQLISLIGTWMQTTAQAWLVYFLTHSAFQLGLVTTLQFLPIMVFSLYGGVIADRLPKRSTIIVTQTIALIQAFVFGILVASGHIQVWHIYILAMMQGLVNSVDNPVRQAFVSEMVGREDLVNAVALNSMVFNGARIIGPSLAGALIAAFAGDPGTPLRGVMLVLWGNALSFIPVIIALFMMRPAELYANKKPTEGSVFARLKEGINYAVHTPQILVIFIMVAAIGTFGFNFTVTLPLIAENVLKTDAAGLGALFSCFGVGSLIGALTTAYTRRVTMNRLLGAGLLFSMALAIVSLSPIVPVSMILIALVGLFGIIFTTSTNTLLQLSVSDNMRGRIMSINVLLFLGSTPIGGFLTGLLSDRLSVPIALVICAVLCLVGVAGGWFYQRTVVSRVAPSPQPERT
jgi:MFS family permease